MAVLLAGGTITFFVLHHRKPAPVTVTAPPPKPPPPKPTTTPSPLTGLPVDPALAAKPIRAAVIENHTDARPQSGLGEAGVVYEALAEGGITRFLAFFLDTRPAYLGPIRSLRTYFIDWALEYNAPVLHAGGNSDALGLVAPLRMKNLDQFSYGSYFFRATDRYAPHNLYITADKLDALLHDLHYDAPSQFEPSPRKKDSPVAAPPSTDININFSYNGYQVEYKYDPATNSYARFLAGAPHIDRNTGKQIFVKNIVIEFMPTAYGFTNIGEQTVRMGDTGLPYGVNKAVVLEDGNAVTGSWSKASDSARTHLLDAGGHDIPLNAGNTWYEIVPIGRPVSY